MSRTKESGTGNDRDPSPAELAEIATAAHKLHLVLQDYSRFMGGRKFDEINSESRDMVMWPLGRCLLTLAKLLRKRKAHEEHLADCADAKRIVAGALHGGWEEWLVRHQIDRFIDTEIQISANRLIGTYVGWEDAAARIYQAVHLLESDLKRVLELLDCTFDASGRAMTFPWVTRVDFPRLPDRTLDNLQYCVDVLNGIRHHADVATTVPVQGDGLPEAERQERRPGNKTLRLSRQKAYDLFNWAVENLTLENYEDRTVYDALRNHADTSDQVPRRFDTFQTYLVQARAFYGDRKYETKSGRRHGRSVVRPDQI